MRYRLPVTACLCLLLALAACTQGEGGTAGGNSSGALNITTSALPGATAGQAYSQPVTAAGGTGSGYSWAVVGGALPIGLSLADGTPAATLSGTPGVTGTFNFTVQVTDDGLNTATVNLSISVAAPAQPLAITTGTLPGGAMGVPYAAVIQAAGGSGPYGWSVVGGTLPGGLTLVNGTPTATLSGAPTATGVFAFTLRVTDAAAAVVDRAFSITVGTVPLMITTTSLPRGTVGHAYSATIETAGGSGTGYSWSVTGGTLPAGLSLVGNGRTADITGTPTAVVGTLPVTFEVQDPGSGRTASVSLVLQVVGPVQIGTGSVAAAALNQPYQAYISAVYGTESGYIWALVGGALPPGLSLTGGTPSATISGTPTAVGSYGFTLEVNDNGDTHTRAYTLEVTSALAITTGSLPAADSGVAYNQLVTAAGGAGVYSWSASGLPAGLSLASGTPSATLSGTTTAAGDYTVLLQVSTPNWMVAQAWFTLTVNPGGFQLTGAALPDGAVAASYSETIATTGGAPTSCAILAGDLPPGLSISATGVVSGIPTATGLFRFLVEATEAGGQSDRKYIDMEVLPANTTLTVTTTSLPDATQGTAYAAWLTAYGGTNSGYAWSLAGGALPPGISINGELLTGTPTASGGFSLTLQVTDSGANSAQATLTLTVSPAAQALEIATGSLPDGIDGQPYNEGVSARGGTPPYNWSVTAGSLPAGTVLAGGTPAAAIHGVAQQGSYSFVLQVEDAAGLAATQSFGVVVSANAPLAIDTDYLPPPMLGAAYSQALTASGGAGGYSWSSLGGDLPFGLSLSSGATATLSGTPTVPGAYRFAIRVSDGTGASCVRVFTLTVYVTRPLKIVAPEFQAPRVAGQPWSVEVRAEGGTGTGYNWSSSSLPGGFTLTPNGASAILSTASMPATLPLYYVDLTDSGANAVSWFPGNLVTSASQAPQVNAALTTGELPGAMVGKAWRLEIGVSLGSGVGYGWSVVSGALPPGIAMRPRGTGVVLEGVPLVQGDWHFSLLVTDSLGAAGMGAFHFRAGNTRSLFGQALGNECAFVLDRSGSMGGARVRTLRAEIENTVLQLEPGQSFDFVTFETSVRTMWGELRSATPANRAEALAFANGEGLAPAGGTATYPALRFALTTYPATLETLVLVTDGVPGIGGSASQLLSDFPGWFAPYGSCEFIGVGIGMYGSAATFMQQLAQSVSGVYVER